MPKYNLGMARNKIVTFRLDEQSYLQLVDILNNDKPVGVRSADLLARKIVCDFLAGRLLYRDKGDRYRDLETYPPGQDVEIKTLHQSSRAPTVMRYARVEQILSKEVQFAKLLTPKTEIACKPDGSRIRFSPFVIQVTEVIHKAGKDAHKVRIREVIQTAISCAKGREE